MKDDEIDWKLAQHFKYASHRSIWNDYSPTSDWREGGEFIDRFCIDIKYDPCIQHHPDGNWFGGLTVYKDDVPTYVTAWGHTALLAAMKEIGRAHV